MAVEKYYSGNAVQTAFDITFPFLISTDVKAAVGGVTKSTPADYSISGNVVNFTTAPPSGADNVKIYRNTEIESARHTYQAGSSIKADALNENNKQLRYKTEEIGFVSVGGSGLGLTAGDKNHITVNSADDWTIDNGVITNAMLSNDSINGDKLVNSSILKSKLANDSVDGTKIEDNSIDSEHYVDKSIDAEHIADNTITANQIAGNAVGNSEMADDAVGLAELSATGTPSSANCLRGDNTWATLPTNNNQLTNGAGYITSIAGALTALDGRIDSYTSNGSFSKPTNASAFIVICIGAGGGGGGARGAGDNCGSTPGVNTSKSYGGTSGATVIKVFNATEMGSSGSITIGSGGAGGTASGGTVNDGSTGGDTYFNPAGTGATVQAKGGSGSGGGTIPGGAGCSATYWGSYPGAATGSSGGFVWDGPQPSDYEGRSRESVLGGVQYGFGGAGASSTGSYQNGGAGKNGLVLVLSF